MGKALRAGEPAAQGAAFGRWGIPVVGPIEPPGRLEGGDVVWLDDCTIPSAAATGRTTRASGQLRALLADSIDELIVVATPPLARARRRVPPDVDSQPRDHDLAVVYSPLMPVTFHERLLARGIELVEVPDAEFDSMGANVLALSPRRVLMVEGNPRTRALSSVPARTSRVQRPRDQPQGRRWSHLPHPPDRAPAVVGALS